MTRYRSTLFIIAALWSLKSFTMNNNIKSTNVHPTNRQEAWDHDLHNYFLADEKPQEKHAPHILHDVRCVLINVYKELTLQY